MRTQFFIFYLILIFVMSIFTSCDENENLLIENDVIESNELTSETRALSYNEPSISNPKLHGDWENVSTIYLNNGPSDLAPWAYSEGSNMNIPYDFRTDIKKADGWKLLAHTILNQNSGQPNYILFYNAKRGILKVFYYQLIPIKNNSLVWVLEAEKNPTSIFPSNTKIQGPLNSKYQYTTTSNVLRESNFTFGALQPGWNAFSFELPYGTIDKNPIIHIKGYHNETSKLSMFGTFTGDITMYIPQSSGFSALMGKIKELVGSVPIGNFQSIASQALTTLSFVSGNTSMYESTTTMTTIKGTTSGKIQLTGSLFNDFSGSIHSLNDIDLRKLNNNEDLGMWTLSSTPAFVYDKYEEIFPYSSINAASLATYSAYLNIRPSADLTSLVVINPLVASTIKSYRVIDYRYISSTPMRAYKEMLKITDDCYYYRNFSFNSETYISENETQYTSFILVHRLNRNPDVNITVEFIYNDGSKMISSRNYAITAVPSANTWLIDLVKENNKTIKYIDSSIP